MVLSDFAMKQDPTPPQSTLLAAPPDTEVRLAKAHALFAGNLTLGTPEAPTQAGFLALARAGKDVWNAWRKAYPEPSPDFSGLDFRGDAAIDFSGFSFTGGKFKSETIFSRVNFNCCTFGEDVRFNGAQFGEVTSFDGAQFGGWVSFDGAQFSHMASFNGAQFGGEASFDGAQFGWWTSFYAWDVSEIQNFWKGMDNEASAQRRASYAGARGLRSDAFHTISFCGVQFEGDVSFQGRIFLSRTYFGPTLDEMTVQTPDGEKVIPKGQPTRFGGISNFHGCTLHQDTSFDHAEFLAPPSSSFQ